MQVHGLRGADFLPTCSGSQQQATTPGAINNRNNDGTIKEQRDPVAKGDRGSLTYLGEMVMTSCPLLASSTGSPPITSPRPPVLEKGEHSALTKTMGSALAVLSTTGAVGVAVMALHVMALRDLRELETGAPARAATLLAVFRTAARWVRAVALALAMVHSVERATPLCMRIWPIMIEMRRTKVRIRYKELIALGDVTLRSVDAT